MSQPGFDVKAMNEQMTQRLLSAPAQPLPDDGYTIRVLEVPGRRTGTVHQTPVGLLSYAGAEFLVCPDGTRDWAENVRAAGTATLRAGEETQAYAADEVHGRPAAEAVTAYLAVVTAPWAVAAFGVPDGASVEEVATQVDRMAVFTLTLDAPDSPAESATEPPTDVPAA